MPTDRVALAAGFLSYLFDQEPGRPAIPFLAAE